MTEYKPTFVYIGSGASFEGQNAEQGTLLPFSFKGDQSDYHLRGSCMHHSPSMQTDLRQVESSRTSCKERASKPSTLMRSSMLKRPSRSNLKDRFKRSSHGLKTLRLLPLQLSLPTPSSPHCSHTPPPPTNHLPLPQTLSRPTAQASWMACMSLLPSQPSRPPTPSSR